MITSLNGNIFRVSGHLRGEFTGSRWIPLTKASDAELWCFYLRLNERLSKQSWGWWFETLSHPIWRHCNLYSISLISLKNAWIGNHVAKRVSTARYIGDFFIYRINKHILSLPDLNQIYFSELCDEVARRTTIYLELAYIDAW